MDLDKLKCVIELGSTKINCVIAEASDENIKIIATSTTPSIGIHNGVIVNPLEAVKAIRSCLSNVENKANVVLKKVNVVLEMPEFSCTRLSKYKKIDGSKIQKDDIVFLLKEAKKEVNTNDKKRTIIHIFNHNYVVDGKKFIKEPIGVYADHLSHEMTFITVPKNIIKNLNEVFVECDLEIERLISNTFALAVNYLSNTEFELGSTIVDIGFEKTSIGIFKNFALIHSRTFPIGIHHVTKDISRGCSLSLDEAKYIRDQIGCFYWEKDMDLEKENNLPEKFFKQSKFRKITKSLVSEIITARVEEIIKIIKKEIYVMGSGLTSGHYVFITGGGSHLPHLNKLCSTFFSTDIRVLGSLKNNFDQKVKNKDRLDSCNGALKIIYYGWETEAIPAMVDKKDTKRSLFSKILGSWA